MKLFDKSGKARVMQGAHKVVAKGRVYWYVSRGGPQFWCGPADQVEARAEEIFDCWLDHVRGRAAVGTVARLVRDYCGDEEEGLGRLATTTKALYRPFLDQIEARFGSKHLDWLNGKEGRAGIREWRKSVTPRTADTIKTVIGALATWARQTDNADRDFRPTSDMRGLYTAPPQSAWSQADIDKAMTGLPPRLSNVVALALNTGLRRTDLCALRWDAIDWEAGVIRWHTSKGRRARRLAVIDITAPLRRTLERCPKVALTVLTNIYGHPWKPAGLANSLEAGLARVGVKGTLHGLRRAAATHLAAQGFSSRDIARRLGWSETEAEAMAATYVDEEERAANGL